MIFRSIFFITITTPQTHNLRQLGPMAIREFLGVDARRRSWRPTLLDSTPLALQAKVAP
jgi:hypothetical protein